MAQRQPKQPYNINPEPVRWSLIAPLFALLLIFVPVPRPVVEEFYSRDMYPWLQNIFTGGTNLLPFALLDAVLIGVGIATVLRIRRLFYVARQRGIMDAVWEMLRRIFRLAALAMILFFWAWGFNYRRQPLEANLPEKQAPKPTFEMLEGAVIDGNALAARLRPVVSNGPELSYRDVEQRLAGPLNAALKKLGRPQLGRPARPKFSLVLTPLFTSAGVTDMVNPLGLEAIVHPDLLPFERPFVVAHEWAHLAGQADEAEASAVGWLACLQGGNEFAYSASLYLVAEASGALPSEWREKVLPRLDPGVRADLDAIAKRGNNEQPALQRGAERIYDDYLRVNRGAGEGTRGYRRALALILVPSMRDVLSGYTITR